MLIKTFGKSFGLKPIVRMNNISMYMSDLKRHMGNNGLSMARKLRPTGGLGLYLADNANKYSKMKTQLGI